MQTDDDLIHEALALTHYLQSRGVEPEDGVKIMGLVLSGMLLNKATADAFIKKLRTTCKMRWKHSNTTPVS